MGLVLLRKGSKCFIGPVFTLFDPPACVVILKKIITAGEYAANPCHL